jgi:phosphopantetheinyl transferase
MPEINISNPANTRIHVWKITESIPELLSLLPESFSSELEKMKTEIHRKQFLSKNILLRRLQIDKQISYRENGKPELPENKYISITHSKNYVAIALANQPVGIDMELAQPKLITVAPKFIHMKEQKIIDVKNQTQLLYFWTAKESIYKLIGESGLSFRQDILIQKTDYQKQTGTAIVRNKQKIKLFFNKIDNNIIICQAIFDNSPV